MNWMTSAKNRVQSKRKKHDSLRLVAYSKLLPHSFDTKSSSTSQSTVGSQMRRPCDGVDLIPQQSKDGMIIASFPSHVVIVVSTGPYILYHMQCYF